MELQRRIAKVTSALTSALGSPWSIAAAFLLIAVWIPWAATKGFSDTSQLPINTLTTCITFLMVFVIQNDQNRGEKAMHAKLDRLLLEHGIDCETLVDLEDEPEKVIAEADEAVRSEAGS